MGVRAWPDAIQRVSTDASLHAAMSDDVASESRLRCLADAVKSPWSRHSLLISPRGSHRRVAISRHFRPSTGWRMRCVIAMMAAHCWPRLNCPPGMIISRIFAASIRPRRVTMSLSAHACGRVGERFHAAAKLKSGRRRQISLRSLFKSVHGDADDSPVIKRMTPGDC